MLLLFGYLLRFWCFSTLNLGYFPFKLNRAHRRSNTSIRSNTLLPFVTVSNYTREAGVRSLERKIGGVCRAVAVQVGTVD